MVWWILGKRRIESSSKRSLGEMPMEVPAAIMQPKHPRCLFELMKFRQRAIIQVICTDKTYKVLIGYETGVLNKKD
jgi:hypothetical protein